MVYPAKIESFDVSAKVTFKQPMLELTKEENRIPLIKKLLAAFSLRVNDVIFNLQTASENYIHFSRLYGLTWFDVSFGLEEWSAKIVKPQGAQQVKELLTRMSQIVDDIPTLTHRVTINAHLGMEENSVAFLNSLNPYVPPALESFLQGRGAFYNLKVSEHRLTVYLTVVPSLFVSSGIYLSIESLFDPTIYEFKTALEVADDFAEVIFKGLNLEIKGDLR
jgi:hypothetical protein